MNLRVDSKDTYDQFSKECLSNNFDFWMKRSRLFSWFKEPETVLTGEFSKGNIKWFEDGQLNITVNALDRHVKKNPDKIAIHWEPNDPAEPIKTFTYKEVLENVCKFANVLKDHDVKKGDRVCFYMSMVPELLFGVLACARIGAIHSVVFGGFSAKALSERINDCEASVVVTVNEGPRGNKTIPLEEITKEALETCKSVKHTFVLKRTNKKSSSEFKN